MIEWVSVKERLPDTDTPVLVTYLSFFDGTPRCDAVAAIDENGTWGWWDGGDISEETVNVAITHWMPLPAPPEGGME